MKLHDGIYASDPQFVRDSAYRSIQRGLLAKLPAYKEKWNQAQKTLTENAFSQIFRSQLEGSSLFQEVYYQDPVTNQWVENDTLILLDDVLIQIEAKAGVAAMQSPATNFENHVRAIQGLVIKAYEQTSRFFKYLESAPELPLYERRNGQYNEVKRIRLDAFSRVFPIGLTIENFSPFSTMCKELPMVEPILGKYPFISMSIDDLFVLNRFLPAVGELFHYLEVRQQVAGIKGALVFDEIDHLGSYIQHNRFDITIREKLAEGAHMVTWDAFGKVVDGFFEGENWRTEPPPSQECPVELKNLLSALAKTRRPGWLNVDSHLRNLGGEGRNELATFIRELAPSLARHDSRTLLLNGEERLLFWLQKANANVQSERLKSKAEATALACGADYIRVVLVTATPDGQILDCYPLRFSRPSVLQVNYAELQHDASRLRAKHDESLRARLSARKPKRPRPNEPCWCGSGVKYKRCHGLQRH